MTIKAYGLFVLLVLSISTQVLSDELCDLYKIPGDCLRQPITVLDGLNFAPNPYRNPSAPDNIKILHEFPSGNSLGLHVNIYANNDKICAILYGVSTGVYTIGMDEFDEFKSRVVSTYNNSEWTDGSGRHGKTKVYDDGETRITIDTYNVMIRDKEGCG